MITLEEMEIMLDEIASEFPGELFKQLNGGINLLPGLKRNTKVKRGNLLILGQYHRGGYMGRYIDVYYGSVVRMYGNRDEKFYRAKLTEILKHEFTHHLESLAGERGLEIKDAKYINDYLKRKNSIG